MYRRSGLLTRVRNLETIGHVSEVAIRHGFGYLFERHNLWDLVPGKRRRETGVPAHPGRHLREMLEELGPTYVKFGQMLSTRADLLPPEVIRELAKLQDQVEPLPYSVIADALEDELGLRPERLFKELEEAPLAAASIGQVHRAVLPGGEPAVVKVQRPGAEESIRRDIDLFYQLADILKRRAGDDLPVDPVQLVDEFAAAISRETDYLLEARNAERLAANLARDTEYVIPRIYPRLSTRRVLTLEYLSGPTLNTAVASLDPSARRQVAELLAHLWFKMVLRDGFFHGDPHPANIVLLNDGRIGLLDFGSVGILRTEDLQEGVRLLQCILDQDLRGVRRALRHLGLTWSLKRDTELDEAIEDLFHRYYEASLADIDTAALVKDILSMAYSLRLRVPARFLLLERALVTLEGVVADIYPEFNVFTAARPYARKLAFQRGLPSAVTARLAHSAEDYLEAIENYPLQIRDILDLVARGELKVNLSPTGIDNLARRRDFAANRIAIALVAGSLALASSIMAAFVDEGPRVLGLSAWSIPGFLIATFFGIWLLWAVLRSGRL